MKKIKKIMALALAVIMCMSMSMAVFAEGTGEETSTITHTITNSSDTHSYEIYQIFTGAYNSETKQLENLKYGANAVGSVGTAVSAADLKTLANYKDTGIQADDQKDITFISQFVTLDNPYKTIAKDATNKSVAVEEGYYLIKDVDNSLADSNEQYTLYLLSVLDKDITITPKTGTTTSVKKLDDINDSDGTAGKLQDSADYDIGDYVPFHLKATMASNVSAYKKYHLTFEDTLESGKFDDISDPVIKVDGTEIGVINNDKYKVEKQYIKNATKEGFIVKVTFTPKTPETFLPAELNGKEVTIDFTAKLGDGANIGQKGNVNTLVLKYSNNPNSSDDHEEGTNPEDTVIVFTYNLIVNKTDEDGKPLEGASFALYKKYTEEQLSATKKTAVMEIKYDSNKRIYEIPSGTKYVKVKEINGTDRTSFTFSGVDDGEYLLVETTVPKGYNALEPKTFTITADHTKEADISKGTKKDPSGNYILTSVSGSGQITLPQHEKAEDNDNIIDGVSTDIKNQSGSVLPETGGIGTTIFYVIGTVLVLGAAVLLVTKRRMSVQK